MVKPVKSHRTTHAPVRIGFVPLVDAAPVIAAHELGLFESEGVHVTLHRQIGWGNVRDKLTFGHLDASHAILGLAPASNLGQDRFAEPLVNLMGIATGGNAITLSRRLLDIGVNSAATLARHIRNRSDTPGEAPLVFAHVLSSSTHHYLLREWVAGAGIDPDEDLKLCVIPPPQMAEQMSRGWLDGFCVGDPWNLLADRRGIGQLVATTNDILPDHPEKVLTVSRRWLTASPDTAVALIRALIRACAYCEDPANAPELAQILSTDRYIDAPVEVVEASLLAGRSFALSDRHRTTRPAGWRFRSFSPTHAFPSATHAAWLLEQMVRWGHAPIDTDVPQVACLSTDSTAFRAAASAAALPCPTDDLAPMPLLHGTYDPRRVARIEDARTVVA